MSRFEKIIPVPPPKHELVRDTTTGLMWAVAFSDSLDYAGALAYIAKLNAEKYLGYDDWRMPTRVELLTLVDDTRYAPAIDTDAFPGTPSEWFWTDTPHAKTQKGFAWIVHFLSGHSGIDHHSDNYRVRAVRGGAA